MTRARSLLRVALAGGISWFLLVGTISLAMVVPRLEVLNGFGGEGGLDYSAYRSGPFAPLTRGFIARILGLGLEDQRALQGNSAGGRLTAAGAREARRTIIEHPFTNDDFGEALSIPSVPFTAKTNISRATRQSAEPDSCAPVGGTAWYRYRAESNRAVVADTFGTTFSTALAVFTGSGIESLSSVRCDSDARGNAIAVFPAKAGTTYYFQITGLVGGGDLVFSLDPLGTITRANVSSSGEQANTNRTNRNPMYRTSISDDGRYVAFPSPATNLGAGTGPADCAPNDPAAALLAGPDPCIHIYVRDRERGTTTLASISSSGELANASSGDPHISGGGRYVVFFSWASNLSPGDGKFTSGIFVHDLVTGRTERIPVSGQSSLGSDESNAVGGYLATISADGRYVAFQSPASDLVDGDTNGDWDVFVYDRMSGETERVSVTSSGRQSDPPRNFNRYQLAPSISADGRYVTFRSEAPNLVPGDNNGVVDDFVRDRLTRKTERISVSSAGEEGNGPSNSFFPFPMNRISADGRRVVFASAATNLVPGDTNRVDDVFVRDRATNTTVRVSVSSSGNQAEGPTSAVLSISSDGRYVAFDSDANNLAPGDEDEVADIFLHDLFTETTTLITLSRVGEESGGTAPSVSRDGRFVAFSSRDSKLVVGDTNDSTDIFVYEAFQAR
jgi:hypothetical protein